jgi:hypothetical protein
MKRPPAVPNVARRITGVDDHGRGARYRLPDRSRASAAHAMPQGMGHGVERRARGLGVGCDPRRPRHAERSGRRRACAMHPHCASARRGSLPYCQPMLRRGAPSRVDRGTSLFPKPRAKALPAVKSARIRAQKAFFHVASRRHQHEIPLPHSILCARQRGGKDSWRLQSCLRPMTLCSDARIDLAMAIPQSYLLANWTARALL